MAAEPSASSAAEHLERINRLSGSEVALSDWEREFFRSIARRRALTAKQAAKLDRIEARHNGSVADPKSAFLDAMEAAGIVPDEPIADRLGPDKLRFRVKGDRKGRRNGWCRFYDDGLPAGSFGSYKLQLAANWHLDDDRELSAEERKRLSLEVDERARRRADERDAAHLEMAEQLRRVWHFGGVVDPTHGYLAAKGISGEGLRQIHDDVAERLAELPMFESVADVRRQFGGALLVPMFDDAGRLWNLQRIWARGAKLYVADARATGLHMTIGRATSRIVVAEGYGTGAVIRRATGLPVAVAFTWSNLANVARLMRRRLPSADIVIAADDDAHLITNPHIKRNIGLEAAQAAALAVGGRLAVPPRKAA